MYSTLRPGEARRPQVLLARLEQFLGRRACGRRRCRGPARRSSGPLSSRAAGRRSPAAAPRRRRAGASSFRRRSRVSRSIFADPLDQRRHLRPGGGQRLSFRRAHRPGPARAAASRRTPGCPRGSRRSRSRTRAARPARPPGPGQDRVRVQDLDRLFVAAHRERRVGGDRRRQLDSGVLELVVGEDLVDQPDLLGARRFDVAPGQEQLLGPRQADRVEELPQPGVAVDQPEFGGRHPQFRARRADPHVAGDRQLEAAAEAVAVDHRHGRPGVRRRAPPSRRGTGGRRATRHRARRSVPGSSRCRTRRRRPAGRR